MTRQQAPFPREKREIDKQGFERLKATIKQAEKELFQIRLDIKETKDSECNLSESPSFLDLISKERAQIAELERLNDELQNCQVIESTDEAFIGFGDSVTVEMQDADDVEPEIVTFKIVSSSPNLAENELSPKSPIGKGLFKKKVGDIVTITLPNGSNPTLKIISKE